MKRWKQLTALILTLACALSLLSGCGKEEPPAEETLNLSVCVGPAPLTMDPIYAEEITDHTVLSHMYENLLRVTADENGNPTVTNGVAKSVEVEENVDGTVTYTFKLRSANWSDGEPVRAQDFVYAWQRLADPGTKAPNAALLSTVVGYDEARATGEMAYLRVSAKNSSTLVVVLDGNYDWFLTEVCTSPVTMPLREDVLKELKEAAAKKNETRPEGSPKIRWASDPTKLVTNGPYVAAVQSDSSLTLTENPHYSGELSGPETVTFQFADTEEEGWLLYEEEKVDAVWPLPQEQLMLLAEDETWVPEPKLDTYSVLFNCDVFEDPLLRKALSLAIDRNALAEVASITAAAAEGLVPPGVPEEDSTFRETNAPLLDNDPELYAENRAAARELLSQAGYESGVSLGEFEYIYEASVSNARVAERLCQMWWDVLRLKVVPRGMTRTELWGTLRNGEYTLAGAHMTSPANDAECFLLDWISDSSDNVLNYENSAYDTLMAIIASAPDGSARMGCLHDAEALLLSIDCAMAPIYSEGTDWQLRDTLTGACRDARGWFCFGDVVVVPQEQSKK